MFSFAVDTDALRAWELARVSLSEYLACARELARRHFLFLNMHHRTVVGSMHQPAARMAVKT